MDRDSVSAIIDAQHKNEYVCMTRLQACFRAYHGPASTHRTHRLAGMRKSIVDP
jgi:hypothetical protein